MHFNSGDKIRIVKGYKGPLRVGKNYIVSREDVAGVVIEDNEKNLIIVPKDFVELIDPTNKKVLHIDMDRVIADFDAGTLFKGYHPPCMYDPGFFENLPPVKGALKAVRALIRSNKYDIYILTQPVANSPISYTEKAVWICKWFPELKDKIIMTQNKILVKGDYLIDDNQKWEKFEGEFLFFDPEQDSTQMWENLLTKLI